MTSALTNIVSFKKAWWNSGIKVPVSLYHPDDHPDEAPDMPNDLRRVARFYVICRRWTAKEQALIMTTDAETIARNETVSIELCLQRLADIALDVKDAEDFPTDDRPFKERFLEYMGDMAMVVQSVYMGYTERYFRLLPLELDNAVSDSLPDASVPQPEPLGTSTELRLSSLRRGAKQGEGPGGSAPSVPEVPDSQEARSAGEGG